MFVLSNRTGGIPSTVNSTCRFRMSEVKGEFCDSKPMKQYGGSFIEIQTVLKIHVVDSIVYDKDKDVDTANRSFDCGPKICSKNTTSFYHGNTNRVHSDLTGENDGRVEKEFDTTKTIKSPVNTEPSEKQSQEEAAIVSTTASISR
ncbi:unnamed protein product [Allacma fusca]|uniref:Uncharacterized protein n=1 Tax=Allacma fusca TaxID=39272 RepID=A0A8J2JR63_9HEXA|nr:unnamed protein product [Allacma fusca]